MKKIALTCLILISTLASISAQPQHNRNDRGGNGGRGDFEKFQLKLLVRNIEISDEQIAPFEALYTEYSAKMKALRPKHERHEGKPSAEEIEAQIIESFDMAEKATALKRDYYTLFREILTPHQILRMYNLERQMHDRLNSEVQNRARIED